MASKEKNKVMREVTELGKHDTASPYKSIPLRLLHTKLILKQYCQFSNRQYCLLIDKF